MSKEWVQGICGCTHNVPWCIITACFPCVTSYSVANKIGKKNLAITSVVVFLILSTASALTSACNQNSPKIQAMERGEDSTMYESDNYFYGAMFFAFVHIVALIIFIIIVAKIRSNVRETYDVAGDSMADCLLSCVCTECALCQMYNHVDYELTQGGATLGGDDKNANIQRV